MNIMPEKSIYVGKGKGTRPSLHIAVLAYTGAGSLNLYSTMEGCGLSLLALIFVFQDDIVVCRLPIALDDFLHHV